ncbi:MAG TPA: DUF2917 domain-containing protein [Burkholderiaceae bacterium]|nr:DUF2917 domain-containing protein [Burkholderiaceae bacterium]
MDHELRYPLTELTDGSLLRLCDAQGRAVVVFEGRVWITQENDLRDVTLDSGESFSIDRPGLTLVEALGPSKVMVLGVGETPASPQAMPSSFELHRRARLERSRAIGDTLAKAFGALRQWLALPPLRPTLRPAVQPLRMCTATH